MPYDEVAARYAPDKMKDGFNTMEDGEEIYYIPNPALSCGLIKTGCRHSHNKRAVWMYHAARLLSSYQKEQGLLGKLGPSLVFY